MVHKLKFLIIYLIFPLSIYSQCECEFGAVYEPGPGLCYIINACSDPNSSNYCPGGDMYLNENCIYDEEVLGCMCEDAYNFNSSATVDDGNCIIVNGCSNPDASNYSSCNAVFYNEDCIFSGCTDLNACNYNSLATLDDGSCDYAELYYDCNGVCLLDLDSDGICDENEFTGCADPMSSNYFCQNSPYCGFDFSTGFPVFILPDGFDDDGSCVYDDIDENNDGIPDNSLQGCEDAGALNYNPQFTVWSPLSYINVFADLQSSICIYPIYGCIDQSACNFNINANSSDGSCEYAETYYDCDGICLTDSDGDGVCDENEILGCTNPDAYNYNIQATDDDDSCILPVYGCTAVEALNYNPEATIDDGSCIQPTFGCLDLTACNYNPDVSVNSDELCVFAQNGYDCDGNCLNDIDLDGVCDEFEIEGCTDTSASNFNSSATNDDNSCEYTAECLCDYGSAMIINGLCYIINACSDISSNNYCPGDVYYNEFCEYEEVSLGCTCENAANYNPNATEDDGSCIILGGCSDETANNFSNCIGGTYYNEVCVYFGCVDSLACNYNSSANADDGSCVYAEEFYDCNGSCLVDLDGNGICDQLEEGTIQTINLESGWNMFSSNLIIDNPSIQDVMSPVSTALLVVKDDAGNIYWPMLGIDQIGNFELGKAYMSKMTFDIDLEISGSNIESLEDISLTLKEGWGLLGYLRNNPMDVVQVISNDYVDIRDELIIMKDENGNVLWPIYDLNSIEYMNPGKGYLIKMNTETEFAFVPNNYEYFHLPLVWPESDDPLSIQNTGGNATMMINLPADEIVLGDSQISTGDKIGVFYKGENKWLCAGFLVWDESMPPAALTIWGNVEDGFGMTTGDDLVMFISDISSGDNYSVENFWNTNSYFVDGNDGYINNALYQTLSMTTSLYIEGFNEGARYKERPISFFKSKVNRSPFNMTLAIPEYAWNFEPKLLSEILAFDSNDLLVGSSVYDGENFSLAIWEDDPTTDQKDGMIEGEKITFKYWSPNNDFFQDLDVRFELGDEFYHSNGLAALSSINLSTEVEKNYSNTFPNPFSDYINSNFYLFNDDLVNISIYDLRGNLVLNLFDGYLSEGMHNLNLSTTTLSQGSYIISIHSNNFHEDKLISKF